MEDFAALRERARKIYAETPLRPVVEFPDPPKQFLKPEQFVDELAEAVLVHSAKVVHPFSLKLVRGEWTLKHIKEWVKEGFQDKIQTIRNDAMILATAPTLDEMKKQATVVASEAGADHSGALSHPELWLRFGEGLGLSREEIARHKPTPLTQIVLDGERYMSMSQRIGGLPSNLRLGERVSSIVYPIWAEALVRKYGVPKQAVAFFDVHEEADEEHSDIGRQVVLGRAATFEAQREIWLHQAKSHAKQWLSYDGYYQAMVRVDR
jgi:pyrroloquinoline-quinone synthase